MEFPPAGGWSRDTRKQFEGNTMAVGLTVGPELRLLNLHFFNICRHHPTLKFKPHATDDERYISGIDGVPLSTLKCVSETRTLGHDRRSCVGTALRLGVVIIIAGEGAH